MTDRGNIGLVTNDWQVIVCRLNLTLDAQPTGNGPISNASPFVADPFSVINLNGRRGAQMDRAVANASGIWTFYDLSQGLYFATEAGVSRQWQIDVAADLTFTVTPIVSSFPHNESCISIG